jgi:DNA-binding NarL/FixJ family response regulator
VVMIGGDATSGQIERLLAQGVSGYIPKPVNVRQVVKVLEAGLAAQGDGRGRGGP